MSNVIFQFEAGGEKLVTANDGENLLSVARLANVAIDAPCSGNGACGKCRVKLVAGEVEAFPSSHITDEEYAEGWRLACVSKVKGDVTVMVPDIASAYKSRMKTADLSSGEEIAIFEALQQEVKDSGIAFENNFQSFVRAVGYGHDASYWKDIMDNLRLVGYDRVMSIEHEDSLMSIDEGLSKAVECLKTVIMHDPKPGTMAWA